MPNLPSEEHARAKRVAKAHRNERARQARARRQQRVVDWSPRRLRCVGCGQWIAPEQVEGSGPSPRVWCGDCALWADLQRAVVPFLLTGATTTVVSGAA